MEPNHPTHLIRGEVKATGQRFYIAMHSNPARQSAVYYAVPHRTFATAMSKAQAFAHCWDLTFRYPGNTYAPIPIKKRKEAAK